MEVISVIAVLIYDLILIIGTTYLVGWCGWSKWTFAFMLLLGYGVELRKKKEKK